MCGIAGFVGFEDKSLLKQMIQTLSHRGPDNEGIYTDSIISLGHKRLSIIDLSENAKQPLYNEDNTIWTVVNGEIYNFQNLKEILEDKSHEFYTNSDSEVIVHLYEEYGVDFLRYIQGMFALALWDQDSKTLILARDRIGKKPLYYSFYNGNLYFASEIKAILKTEIPIKVNKRALNFFMHLGYIPEDITMFEGINKLRPGNILFYRNGRKGIETYWDIYDFSNIEERKDFFINKIDEILEDSVADRLISDRPIGLFLSGGVDSTTILYFVNKLKDISGLNTFSVGFDVEPKYEKFNKDYNLARNTSDFFNTNHHEVVITEDDFINDFRKTIYHLDDPIENETQLALYKLSKYAKSKVDVVLSGNGGDELFGGYPRYSRNLKEPRKSFLNIISHLPQTSKMKLIEYLINLTYRAYKKIPKITPSIYNRKDFSDYVAKWYFDSRIPIDKRVMYADLRNKLAENFLMTTDKMTMANGLEQREPFLDFRLVEYAFRVPIKYKIFNNTTKYIIKQMMRDRIPKETLYGKKYWFVPIATWPAFFDVADEYLSTAALKRSGFFDPEYVGRMYEKHKKAKELNRAMLWKIITFQVWYNVFIDDYGF